MEATKSLIFGRAVSVGVVICVDCTMENDVLIGVNATVIQEIKIGNYSALVAGSIVLADAPVYLVLVGAWVSDITSVRVCRAGPPFFFVGSVA